MLKIISYPAVPDFGRLMYVYQQSILQSGRENYPYLDENLQLLEAEQDFYAFLKAFLKEPNTLCAVWMVEERYVAVLRSEPYRDGMLITGVETAPEYRNCGYAKQLLRAVVDYLHGCGVQKIYSHIHIANASSVRVHLSCGFVKVLDSASFIDGSVNYESCTYLHL